MINISAAGNKEPVFHIQNKCLMDVYCGVISRRIVNELLFFFNVKVAMHRKVSIQY